LSTTGAPRARAAGSLSDHIDQNIEALVNLQRREWDTMPAAQRRLERISRLVARPFYLIGIIVFVGAWIAYNLSAPLLQRAPFDPPPFEALQGIVSLTALLTATVVLIAQNRQTRIEKQRMHLDLQVNLLTEQKVSKLIHLLEELRRDLPFVEDRHDQQATLLQEGADAEQVLSALEQRGLTKSHGEDAGGPARS
jgi:uncharacterized membrane protein